MKFSLIQICEKKEDGTISGWWVQDHHGTLETALAKAESTAAVNSSRLTIPVAGSHYMQYAVVEQVVGPCPIHRYLLGLVPLGEPVSAEIYDMNESKYEAAGRKAFCGLQYEDILRKAFAGGPLAGAYTCQDAIDYFVEHGEELEALGLI